MSEFAPVKREFIRALGSSGTNNWRDIAPPENVAPEWVARYERWTRKFYTPPEISSWADPPRLVNHFLIGADPEFVFLRNEPRDGVHVVHAEEYGLIAGLAFGADNNGRLVELRPYPARSALDVVASMMVELRWLAQVVPDASQRIWKAGGFAGNDGLGGHIHFGRKRNTRDKEVVALDRLYNVLAGVPVFDSREIHERTSNTRYGRLGDIREQRHGYEYRALPSWLDSPWMAFLSMTMAKLAVYDPGLSRKFFGNDNYRHVVRNTLSYHQSQDDDARLALHCWLKYGAPRPVTDFRPNWGVAPITPVSLLGNDVLPPFMEARPEDRDEVFNHLLTGTPLRAKLMPKVWKPLPIPKELAPMQKYINTHVAPGIGELTWDMATLKMKPIRIGVLGEQHPGQVFEVTSTFCKEFIEEGEFRRQVVERFPSARVLWIDGKKEGHILWLSRELLAPAIFKKTKTFLLSGILPIWQLGHCPENAGADWKKATVPTHSPKSALISS